MGDDYQKFILEVDKRHDINLSLYKETQMKRRITTLRNKRGFKSYIDYYHAMNENNELMNEFIDRLTINVSEFFRNRKRWEVLKNRIIPELIENRPRLKIWSAACSTGEEAYSLAILFNEFFPQVTVQIIATDIDETVLKEAKKGSYLEQSLKEVPTYLKKKYFHYDNNTYQVDPKLGKQITFAKHNLLADRYPSQIDLLVCRNVLIYFTDEAKEEIYHGFKDALNPGGVLFVGSTEQIFSSEKYQLKLYDTFFYQKIEKTS
jgi:chemotaxis protein methyltransferase CheR